MPHATKDAVVLNVTTGALHIPYIPRFSGYTSSKMAAARLFDYLHHEQPDKFVLNVHPGVIKTAMGDKAGLEGVPFDDGAYTSAPITLYESHPLTRSSCQ